MAKAPQQILQIRHTNPAPPDDFGNTGATKIALGKDQPTPVVGGVFPSVDARQEWKQIQTPEEDYDVDLVGACGWVLEPKFSGGDVPFDHPFGFDWEFMLAVDDDPSYRSLLARGNQVPAGDEDPDIINHARDLQIPVPEGRDGAPSLLGVEIDGGLVPNAFTDRAHVAEGDRMAVFGRWIVDCGHAVTVPVPNPGDPTYRSEIHPPLLMASARVTEGSIATGSPVGPPVTRVLVTSRPYLVGQRFTTNPDNAYSDLDPADDGPFVDHMVNEYVKANDTILGIPSPFGGGSTMVEAHPKIKSRPYHGAFLTHLVVRPPQTQPAHGGILGLQPHLAVSYQFTVRSGCTVEVSSTAPDTIDIFIAFGAGTSPPSLPQRHDRTWSKDELAKMNSEATTAILGVELVSGLIQTLNPLHGSLIGAAVVEGILSRGIKTDEYDTEPVRSVNILDASHMVAAAASQLPVPQGIVTDNNQPYPVFGWLEASLVSPQMKQ